MAPDERRSLRGEGLREIRLTGGIKLLPLLLLVMTLELLLITLLCLLDDDNPLILPRDA